MQNISVLLSLINNWITTNLSELPYKYQEIITITIISPMIFNCSSRSKKELPPLSPRKHLTCSQAWSAPLASLPVLSSEKRGHQAERTQATEGRTNFHRVQKNILAPINFLNDCSWKNINTCQIDRNADTGMPTFSLWWREAKDSLTHLAVCWHRYQLYGFLYENKTYTWLHHVRLRPVLAQFSLVTVNCF